MRRLLIKLAGVTSLVFGLLVGASAPVGAAETSGCTGDVVVAFGVELMARPGEHTGVVELSDPLAAGEWSVTAISTDSGDGRHRQDQPLEQWTLTFGSGPSVGPTSDLDDEVRSATAIDDLGTVVLEAPVSELTVRHVKPPVEGGTQSVVVVCIGLSSVHPPPAPPPAPPPSEPDRPPTPSVPSPEESRVSSGESDPVVAFRAEVVVQCGFARMVVTVANDGTADATVDVSLPRSAVVSDVAVAAGQTARVVLPIDLGFEDTLSEIRVSDGSTGEDLFRTDVAVDCLPPAEPTVDIAVDCLGERATVTLGNNGGSPVELTVIQERVGSLEPVVLMGAETVDLELEIDGARLDLRVVDGAGVDVVRRSVDTSCPAEAVAPPAGPPDDLAPAADDPGGPDEPFDDAVATAVVDVTADLDCDRHTATIDVTRVGRGSERVVVLLDDSVAAVVELDGTETRRMVIGLDDAAGLVVSRAEVDSPLLELEIDCGSDDGAAGLVASSLVVLAVLASAAGIVPWPSRRGHLGL